MSLETRLFFILFVNDIQALQKQVFFQNNLPLAQRSNKLGKTAGGNKGRLVSQLRFDPLDQAVDHGGGSVHHAAAHTIDGVLADDLFGLCPG